MAFTVGIDSSGWALLLMSLIIISVMLYQLRCYYLGQAAFDWHVVKATVAEAYVKVREDDDFNYEESAPHIEYKYKFKGRLFKRKRVQFGNLWSRHYDLSAELLRGVRLGGKVGVRINPKNPGQSTLKPGYHGHIITEMILGFMVLLVLLVFALS